MTKSRDLGNLAQTVAVNLPTSLGTAGQTLVVNSGADGLEFGAASGGGVTVYTGLSGTDGTPSGATYLLNASSPSAGDLAYVSSNTSLYQNNGNGWYRIAVINTTPTISSVADASSNTTPFTLTGGTNTVITVTASDADEGTDLTYSHSVTSGSLNGTTVTQGTGANENVFTIAPHSSNATTFSITFTVSDSINAATSVAAFTLAFNITDSHTTSLLMATDGLAGSNSTITYDTGSSTDNSLTVTGDAYAGTFSPYRAGGYSVEFVDEGSNGYGLKLPAATFNNPSTTFTIEAWVYLKSYSNNATGHYNRAIMGKGATYLNFGVTSDYTVQLYHYDGTARYPKSTGTVPLNEWTHVCAKVDSGSITFYINGTASGTGTWYGLHSGHVNTDFYVGTTADTNGDADKWWDGYLSNVRFVDGTAITPASGGNEALDPATTNTEFLLCASNRFIDSKSTSPLTVTLYRTPKIVPISPYDYEEYDESTNGGSVYFDGTGDYLSASYNASFNLGTGAFTWEAWVYPTTISGFQGLYGTNGGGQFTPKFVVTLENGVPKIHYNNLTNGSNIYTNSSSTLKANEWTHLAFVRDGSSNWTWYVNGASAGTGTNSTNITFSSESTYIGYGGESYFAPFTGYISDMRLVKGSALTISVPTAPLSAVTNTSLLLSGTDAHVIDKSQGNNLKLVGTAASTSALTSGSTPPYIGAAWANTSAVSFDGNSDYVIMPQIPLGSGNFTIEAYTYLDARLTSYPAIFSNYSSFAAGALGLFAGHGSSTTTNYQVAHNGAGFPAINGGPITYDQWVHLCLERYNGTITLYKDGSSVNSFSSTATLNGVGSNFYIGTTGDSISTGYLNGWIQDFRVTVGKARYQGAFTKPAAPLKG